MKEVKDTKEVREDKEEIKEKTVIINNLKYAGSVPVLYEPKFPYASNR